MFDKGICLPVIYPEVLSLLTTMYCTAKCRNCCFQCSPQRRDRMSLNDIKFYIDYVTREFPSIKLVVFSGGECVSLKKDLLNSICYAQTVGLKTRIVTNAFWASDYKKAYKMLSSLKDAGLDEINYSTGDDHQEWVSYENIVNACLAAKNLGFNVLVNVETHHDSIFSRTTFENDERVSKYLGNNIFDANCIKVIVELSSDMDMSATSSICID